MSSKLKAISHVLLRTTALGLVLAAGLALGQSPVGALSGKAEPGAVAVITNPLTGARREVKVGRSGRYQQRNLPIGQYQVVIRHADGREDAPRQVDVHIGITVPVP